MKAKFKRLLPTPESVRENRWLRWLGPALQQPRLWHMGRRAIALGVALGIFFGLLIPVAQIPVSAAMAVVLRANVPMAIASTLVTNPVTFGPLYYAAYRVGSALVDERPATEEEATRAAQEAARALETINIDGDDTISWGDRFRSLFQRLNAIGRPLIVGLLIMAVICSTAAYFLVSVIWTLNTRLTRRRRVRYQAQLNADAAQAEAEAARTADAAPGAGRHQPPDDTTTERERES